MKPLQRFGIAVGLLCLPWLASACDICGCAGGGMTPGLLPLVPTHFVGLRGGWQGYRTDAHGSETDAQEYFRNLDVWARWLPHRRVQVFATLPIVFNFREFTNGKTLNINGLGDISLLTQFSLLGSEGWTSGAFRHSLQAGAGLKLPTGHFEVSRQDATGVVPPAFQAGTGSLDVLFSMIYALRSARWGSSVDATFQKMGGNRSDYRFGNRLSWNLRTFFQQKVGQNALLVPFVGMSADQRGIDWQQSKRVYDSGGWAAFGFVGAEFFLGKMAFNASVFVPVASYLSNNRVSPMPRVQMSAVYFLGKTKNETKLIETQVFPSVLPEKI